MPRPVPVSYADTKRDQNKVVRHWMGFHTLSMALTTGSGVSTVKRPR